MNLYEYYNKPEELNNYSKRFQIPSLLWEKAVKLNKIVDKDLLEKNKKYLAIDPEYAYQYALITNKRFPEGEDAIAKNPSNAYFYAERIIKDTYSKPIIESIASNAITALNYSVYILDRKRFPEGEDAMAKDPFIAVQYAKSVLRNRFKKAEPIIMKSHYRDDYEMLMKRFNKNKS